MRIEDHLGGKLPHVDSSYIRPETFRLPRTGEKHPYFGLSRSTYYELNKAGIIHFLRLRKRGNVRGITLIPFDEVLAYVRTAVAKP